MSQFARRSSLFSIRTIWVSTLSIAAAKSDLERYSSAIFNSNLNLLYEFPNYKILYINYKNLCENLGKKDWISFFEVYESKENIKKDKYFDELSKIKNKTSDKVLNKLIKMHMSF